MMMEKSVVGSRRDLKEDEVIQPETFGEQDQLQRSWLYRDQKWALEVFYEEATQNTNERLKMVVTMPDQTWFSIGFGGTNMFNVDMIGWHANGSDSYVKDYFSVEKNDPPEDKEQNLTNEEVKFVAKDPALEKDYDKVTFVTYRDLETTDKE